MNVPQPRVMVLDGDYSHTLAVQAELKRYVGAKVFSVASSERAPGHRSRYTDVAISAPRSADPAFAERLLKLVIEHEPDIVVPVGHAAFASTLSVADRFPQPTRALVPDATGFAIASSKTRTYDLARDLGIRVPEEYLLVDRTTGDLTMPNRYPIFAKARYEQGGDSTALIGSAAELCTFDAAALGGDVIFQEYIAGNSFTYAQCGYYEGGEPIISYQHVELRSVPRRGGSGTRVQVIDDPIVANLADRLLRHLNWNGVAQVEFKVAQGGEFVLMEINPKVWASYALAETSGHPVVATALARALDLEPILRTRPQRVGTSMVFPMREFAHALKHRKKENLAASVLAMLWPPTRSDIDVRDIRARVPRA